MSLLIQYQSPARSGGHYVDPQTAFALILGELSGCDIWFHVGASVEFCGILLRRNGVTFWL